LAAATGASPAPEVLDAEAGLDRRAVRQVRGLVRHGGVASDVPCARLAVALARDAQRRRPEPLLLAFCMVLVVGCVALFAARLNEGHIDLLTAVWGGSAGFGIYGLWLIRRMRTRAPQAELRNLSFLREAGTPYRYEGGREPVRVPVPALVASTLVILVFYDLGYGALTLAMNGRALSIGRVAGHGAGFAVLMTILNMTLMRSRNARQALRSTAGRDG
jgi:hypothetical protein